MLSPDTSHNHGWTAINICHNREKRNKYDWDHMFCIYFHLLMPSLMQLLHSRTVYPCKSVLANREVPFERWDAGQNPGFDRALGGSIAVHYVARSAEVHGIQDPRSWKVAPRWELFVFKNDSSSIDVLDVHSASRCILSEASLPPVSLVDFTALHAIKFIQWDSCTITPGCLFLLL